MGLVKAIGQNRFMECGGDRPGRAWVWMWAVGLGLALAGPVWAAEPTAGSESDMTHRMMALVLQLGIIVLAARGGNLLFRRLRLPGVVGELMAGVLIGPYALGAIALPGFRDGLFHIGAGAAVGGMPVSPELYGLCSVASVVLLFLVGLETDIKLFLRYSLAGSLVGIGGVTTSFLVGNLMAVTFSDVLFGEQLGFLDAPCLFLGIISTATSVGITARILSDQRKLDSPEGVTILAGAVIDDVLGMILLAVGMGILAASSEAGAIEWGSIGRIAVRAVGIWLVATVVGLLAARRIGRMLKQFGDPTVVAVMALALSLILAGLFEQTGLAMIIGAYVMGLSLSRTDLSQVIRERLNPIQLFLVPVFFTVMGMLVDVRLLASREVLGFGVLYTVVAALAKAGGCGIPALFVGFNPLGAARIGAGMLPRGEVTLIIAGTGLAAGLLNPALFGVVVFMTLCSALLAPPLVVALFRRPAPGVRRPAEPTMGEPVTFSFPSVQAAELLVSKLVQAFEAEGFLVHTLSRHDRMVQLRKEALVIGLRHAGTDIVFSCGPAEVSIVNTAMLEVVAELEQTLRALRRPLDAEAISRRVQETSSAPPTEEITLHGFLDRRTLTPTLRAADKPGVIDELLALLAEHGLLHDVERARAAVLERETAMSTGMQYGIALPHARTDAVDRLVCAIGLHPHGIDFDSIDERPTHIVVLALSPLAGNAPHMQFMSMVSQVLDERGRSALLACDTADEMFAVLTGDPVEETLEPQPLLAAPAFLRRLAQPRDTQPQLAGYLRRDWMTVRLTGTTREEVIDELLALIAHGGALEDVDAARAALLEREAQMPTGMEHGIAIPHARTDTVDQLVCAVGIHPRGVDFGSLDGEPSTIFVLTLSPPSASTAHVQFMSLVSKALDEEGRKRALAAPTREALHQALVGEA